MLLKDFFFFKMTLETIPSFVEGILAGGGGKSGSLVQNLLCESGS